MVLVTGGSGLVGSRLLYDLVSEGKKVRALLRPGTSPFLFEQYTSTNPSLRSLVEWVEGDVLDLESLEAALAGVEKVYHCAGLISFQPADRKLLEQVNIGGTANLVNLALESPTLKQFIHLSSVATLGRISKGEVLNEDSHWLPGNHNSNYAVSKYGGEREVWRGIAEGLPGVILNPSVIIGPGNRDGGSGNLFQRIHKGFPFYSEGVSGFVGVKDVSNALRFVTDKKIIGERFVLNTDNLTYGNLFMQIADAMDVQRPSVKVQPWMGALAWRAEKLRSFITRKPPFITQETTHSALSEYRYSAKKIEGLGFRFDSLKTTINETAAFLKEHQLLTAF